LINWDILRSILSKGKNIGNVMGEMGKLKKGSEK